MTGGGTRPKGPVLFEREGTPAPSPARAAPVPDIGPLPEGRAMQAAAALAGRQLSWAARLFWSALVAAAGFWLSLWAWDAVTGLLAARPVLGLIGAVLTGLVILGALALAVREWAAYARLARLDDIQRAAGAAADGGDLKAARAVAEDIVRLYARRPDTEWGRSRFAARAGEIFDADAVLRLAEAEILGPLDAQAVAEAEAAARQVALVTAVVPLALADVVAALTANLRMIRRIAEIYGGRSGSFGSVKLLRRVFGSLVAAGALALTDDMIGSVAGGGVLSKLSRRFGEGVVNGALTARVGVAAMELCRPMPFVALERPAVSSLVGRALTGLVSRG